MKTLRKLAIVTALIASSVIHSQTVAYVNAESGLSIRQKPDLSSKKIGKLKYREKATIIEESDVAISLYDEGKEISGKWVKIKTLGGKFRQ